MTKSVVGVWDGPARKGFDHFNRPCRARLGQELMIIGEGPDGLFVQFNSFRQPQHLRCLHADVVRDPDIDWSQAA